MAYPTLVIGPSGSGSGTTITVPNPGVQPGELVIVGMMNNSNTAVSGLPAGWNVGGSNAASSSYDRFTVVWARAESATWPLTATIAATRDFVYQPIRVQNWDSAVDPQFLLSNRGASGTTVNFGSITPTGGASDAIDIVFLGRNNPTLGAATAPTDYTSFIDVTQGTTAGGTALQVASCNSNLNPTGTKTATDANSSLFYNTGHIVVKGGNASPGTVYQVSGSSVVVSDAAGSITSLAGISGTVAALSDTSGALAGVGTLTGTVVATSATAGAVSATSGISSTSSAISTTAGSVTYRASASGAVAAASATYGLLSGSLSPTSVPKQSDMPAAPFDLYPAPSMSWVVGAAPSGTGYASVGPDNQLVRLLGSARKGTQAGSVSGFVNPAPLQDIAGAGTGTNPLVYPPFGVRILTNSPEVWFRLGQRSYAGFSNVSSRAAVRIRVNGKWISLMPVYVGSTIGFPSNPENITAGEYALKLTFPDSQNREIEINTHLEFGGVVIPSAYSALTPRQAEHVAVFLDGSLGGSEKHQTGNFSLSGADGSGSAATYTAVTSYEWALGQVLAYDSIVNSAAGSSGFSISGDTASWKSTSKVPKDVIEHLGDLNVIGSANNDDVAGQTPAQVDVAANTVYGNVATACKPGALNVAMGMFTAPALGSQATVEARVAPYNDVLKARAQQWGFWFVNPTTGQTFDPQGNLRRTTSNWVYQDTSDISSDNTHPTQRGANNLGVKFADAIRMAHEASAPQAMSGTAAATSTTSGTVALIASAGGTSSALSITSGALTKASPLAGTATAVSTSAGTIAGAATISGTAETFSATSGSAVRMVPLSGQSNVISNSVGQITAALSTGAAVQATSTASGASTTRTQAAGVADAVSGTTGSASPTGSLAGTVAAQSASIGQVVQRAVIAGQVTVAATTTGNPIVASGLSGSASAASASSGAISLQAQALGVVAAIATVSGALVPAAGTGGSVGATSSTAGAATLLAKLSGGVNATSAAIAAVVILRSVAGSVIASSSTSGSIVNSGIIPMPDILELESITPTLTLVALQERAQ